MIQAYALDLVLGDQVEHEGVGDLEQLRPLHAQAGQVVDVKEPPIVDLRRCHPPIGNPIGLAF